MCVFMVRAEGLIVCFLLLASMDIYLGVPLHLVMNS